MQHFRDGRRRYLKLEEYVEIERGDCIFDSVFYKLVN